MDMENLHFHGLTPYEKAEVRSFSLFVCRGI